ncbi:MAG: hypothetical protein IJ991_00250 [Thermoguttaceae bacterium]|nr:hypothetical protein [Thermoguttaceae bacterium]
MSTLRGGLAVGTVKMIGAVKAIEAVATPSLTKARGSGIMKGKEAPEQNGGLRRLSKKRKPRKLGGG